MSRVRKANEKAIEKTEYFLWDVKSHLDNNIKFNSTELQEKHGISKSTFSIIKKFGYIENGKWISIDPCRNHALEILEVLRQQASKRIDAAIDDSFLTAIERLTTSMNTLSTHNENSLKRPILSRALNQAEQSPTNHLFSQVESNEAKKFELLKAIATGMHSTNNGLDYANNNDFIIKATEDLYNKFFKIKN